LVRVQPGEQKETARDLRKRRSRAVSLVVCRGYAEFSALGSNERSARTAGSALRRAIYGPRRISVHGPSSSPRRARSATVMSGARSTPQGCHLATCLKKRLHQPDRRLVPDLRRRPRWSALEGLARCRRRPSKSPRSGVESCGRAVGRSGYGDGGAYAPGSARSGCPLGGFRPGPLSLVPLEWGQTALPGVGWRADRGR
jgi:hypothetical protein